MAMDQIAPLSFPLLRSYISSQKGEIEKTELDAKAEREKCSVTNKIKKNNLAFKNRNHHKEGFNHLNKEIQAMVGEI